MKLSCQGVALFVYYVGATGWSPVGGIIRKDPRTAGLVAADRLLQRSAAVEAFNKSALFYLAQNIAANETIVVRRPGTGILIFALGMNVGRSEQGNKVEMTTKSF